LTKLTHIQQFPQLETALFVLMSYSTFLIAEVANLTGILSYFTYFFIIKIQFEHLYFSWLVV